MVIFIQYEWMKKHKNNGHERGHQYDFIYLCRKDKQGIIKERKGELVTTFDSCYKR